MSVILASGSSAGRTYSIDCLTHVPGFGAVFGIIKLKQIGVWDKLPQALRRKIKEAKGTWGGLKITKKDLDSIPDDVWMTIASELRLG
jgi:hypothetical protein